MLWFESDYVKSAAPQILQRLLESSEEAMSGYGQDSWCEQAREKIRAACECPEADIFFLTGGTQTNMLVIDALLKPYEGVAAARTGHISTHEAGAIEAHGHKVLELPGHEGKIHRADLEALLESFWQDANHEHMVFPGMVYISHPTEYGTLYTKRELEELSGVCRKYKIPLYMDGARLGYGLMSHGTDVTLPVIAECCDAFYIGGTKVGALFGEALVFPKHNMPEHFLTIAKQHGALLAKGWLLGLQFDTLFSDNMYFTISRHAIEMAELLKTGLTRKGYTLYLESPTNQQFVVLENEKYEELRKEAAMGFWEKPDAEHTVVRLATSWATRRQEVEEFLKLL